MNLSRLDVPQSFATCSRVFSWPDVLSEVMGLQSKPHIHCSSVSTRGPATKALAARWPSSEQCNLGPVAHPARVLSPGKSISDRHAGNSVILRTARQ